MAGKHARGGNHKKNAKPSKHNKAAKGQGQSAAREYTPKKSANQKAPSKEHVKPEADTQKLTSVDSAAEDTRMSRKKRIFLIVACSLLALLIAGGIGVALFLNSLSAEIKLPEEDLDALGKVLVVPEASTEPFYMLLIGSDSRDPSNAGSGRSDTIMLTRIDAEQQQLTIVSIPRDVEIQLDGYGSQKVNASFTYGGPAGAVEAVSALCGVPISYYIEVDFEGVTSLVDKLDGIDVVVPMDMELDGVYIPAGEQHLNGEQALIMSRCRSFPDGDLTRVQNQRVLMQAIIQKVLAADVVSLPGLVSDLAECVETTMEINTAADLVLKYRGMDLGKMYMATIPTYFNSHDGASYLAIAEPGFSDMMARINQGLPPVDPALEAIDPALEGEEAL